MVDFDKQINLRMTSQLLEQLEDVAKYYGSEVVLGYNRNQLLRLWITQKVNEFVDSDEYRAWKAKQVAT